MSSYRLGGTVPWRRVPESQPLQWGGGEGITLWKDKKGGRSLQGKGGGTIQRQTLDLEKKGESLYFPKKGTLLRGRGARGF